MGLEEIIIFIIEIIGTIAFAMSGAMVGINKKMDIFGVCILGVTTAVGGGMIRDTLLNKIPYSLQHPIYVEISVATTIVVFIFVYFKKAEYKESYRALYYNLMMAIDSLGLGVFTAIGVSKGITSGYEESTLLLVFLGAITGVGGGLIRDIMAGVRPYIFTKHIYACASIAGAFTYIWVYRTSSEVFALISSTAVVVVIRYLARYYKWNLPYIEIEL